MKLTNTYLSDDCTRKATASVDLNGHYMVKKTKISEDSRIGWNTIPSMRVFKKFESAERACKKWVA